jgi:SAM-dependent methyltransferase
MTIVPQTVAPVESAPEVAGGRGIPEAPDLLDSLLRCPCPLHHEVVVDRPSGRVVCTHERCPLKGRQSFPIIDGQPILIDFEHSIVDEAVTIQGEASCLVARPVGWQKAISRLIFGDKPGARRNAARFLELLKTSDREELVLVIGGAQIGDGAEPLYRVDGVRIIAFDVYKSEHTHFVADAHSIPIADGQIDGVWIQAVLEHVLSPEQVVVEIGRVLRPGGLVYAETAFMQQVHEGPYDFTRVTESGHRWLFRRFELIESGVERGPFTALLWSIRYALAGLIRSRQIATLICLPFFWLRYLDHLIPASYAIDAACDVYFLGRKCGATLRPKDMIAAYAGAQSLARPQTVKG